MTKENKIDAHKLKIGDAVYSLHAYDEEFILIRCVIVGVKANAYSCESESMIDIDSISYTVIPLYEKNGKLSIDCDDYEKEISCHRCFKTIEEAKEKLYEMIDKLKVES